jgi:AraC-like DNA-binding protein
MTICDHIPTAQLRPFIKTFKIIESQDELLNRVLPNMSVVIAFRYKGDVNYLIDDTKKALPIATITGLKKSVRLINYTACAGTIIVLFQSDGAAAFFKEPLHELFDESIALDCLITRQEVAIVEERLAETQNNTQRIAIVEQFLLTKLHHPNKDFLVENAIQIINSLNGQVKMRELAATLCISQDAFEKRFRKAVGSSPKQFSSIVRMKSIIKQRDQNKSLTDLAFEGGYFDQPHFNKDFKLFTGQTPSEFFKSLPLW